MRLYLVIGLSRYKKGLKEVFEWGPHQIGLVALHSRISVSFLLFPPSLLFVGTVKRQPLQDRKNIITRNRSLMDLSLSLSSL